jgi:hypothetical protein
MSSFPVTSQTRYEWIRINAVDVYDDMPLLFQIQSHFVPVPVVVIDLTGSADLGQTDAVLVAEEEVDFDMMMKLRM